MSYNILKFKHIYFLEYIYTTPNNSILKLAGVDGFEPSRDGVKVRCLTAWLHPNDVFYCNKYYDKCQ